MTTSVVIAQAQQPAPIVPFQPPSRLPLAREQSYGDGTIGAIELSANGNTCKIPKVADHFKFNVFFTKCPPEQFMHKDHPDCSCKAYVQTLDDFGSVSFKWGGQYFSTVMPGTAYPLLWLALVIALMAIFCAPAVYYFSYRMSRREIVASQNSKFFLTWHQQRVSSFICMMMVLFGFMLMLLGVTGNATISLGEGWNISTTAPGLVFALFGFLVWRIVLTRKPQKTRSEA